MKRVKMSEQPIDLVQRADAGDSDALGELLERSRDRLIKIVSFRMDGRLRSRVDAADVVQDAFVEATKRIGQEKRNTEIPFFLWLRMVTLQKLADTHRHHLGVKARAAGREVALFSSPLPQATSAVIAAQLLGKLTSPSQAAMRIETQLRIEETLNAMDELDREVLVLRFFEMLSNQETARILNVQESTASNRFVRALKKLKGGVDGEALL